MILRLLLFPLILLLPQIEVNRAKPDAIKVEVAGYDEQLALCAKSGLEVRYRFETRMCSSRSLWFDHCSDTVKEVHSLQYDPISERYRIVSDKLSDQLDPKSAEEVSLEIALRKIAKTDPISFESLDNRWSQRRGPYVSARVLAECKGEYNQTIERISYFLSFGLVRTSGYDSGWVGFDLAEEPG